MSKFKVGVVIEAGVIELLAEVDAENFETACLLVAETHEAFRADFDMTALTLRGRRLINLDDYFRHEKPGTLH